MDKSEIERRIQLPKNQMFSDRVVVNKKLYDRIIPQLAQGSDNKNLSIRLTTLSSSRLTGRNMSEKLMLKMLMASTLTSKFRSKGNRKPRVATAKQNQISSSRKKGVKFFHMIATEHIPINSKVKEVMTDIHGNQSLSNLKDPFSPRGLIKQHTIKQDIDEMNNFKTDFTPFTTILNALKENSQLAEDRRMKKLKRNIDNKFCKVWESHSLTRLYRRQALNTSIK